jgi:hypothetical protein
VAVAIPDRDLERIRARPSCCAIDGHTIGADLDDVNGAEVGDRIRSHIGRRIMDLVEQLFLARCRADDASGAWHLRHDRGTTRRNFGNGEPERAQAGNVFAARIGEISARHLSRAFEQVTNERGAAELRPRVVHQSEFLHQGSDEEGRIGHAAGDHDAGAGRECFDDRLRADVGVRRDHPVSEFAEALTGFDDRVVALAHEADHVVSGNGGNRQATKAEPLRKISDDGGSRRGIRGAHIREDPRAALVAGREHGLESRHEQRVVARLRISSLRLLRQRDRSFGETLEYEVVERAFLRELDGRLDAIALEAGSAADTDGFHRGNTPSATAAMVMTTEAAKRNGAVNR